MVRSRTISLSINASPRRVYEYASNPANLPRWAPGFFKSIADRNGLWVAETIMGEVTFNMAPRNEHGVLDHGVTLSTGESSLNPMRVVANGQGSELLFTLFQDPPMTEEELRQQAEVVLSDLQKLKTIIEKS
jgi:hypothetical protein